MAPLCSLAIGVAKRRDHTSASTSPSPSAPTPPIESDRMTSVEAADPGSNFDTTTPIASDATVIGTIATSTIAIRSLLRKRSPARRGDSVAAFEGESQSALPMIARTEALAREGGGGGSVTSQP